MASAIDPDDRIELFVFGARGENLRLSPRSSSAQPVDADLKALATGRVSDELWSDGGHFLTAAVRRPGYMGYSGLGWTVVVRQPIELSTTPARNLRASIWLAGTLSALLLASLGWWSTTRLMRPLREVADAAQAELSPSPSGGDEAHRLSHALGSLVTRLRARELELLDLTADLERRVSERTAELERRNAELRGMARMVSHDVRGPIGSVIQALHVAAADKPEKHGYWIDLITRECERVSEVLHALLALSSSESQPIRASSVDMQALVAASIDRQRGITGYAGVVEVSALPEVRGDAVLLGQVWDNLIGNAMKFARLGASPRVTISARQIDDRWSFLVEDNGLGFEQAQVSRLFTAFERLTRDARYPGTGLGLSIVQRIVQRHGGAVDAQGESGRGARFFFTLPISASHFGHAA